MLRNIPRMACMGSHPTPGSILPLQVRKYRARFREMRIFCRSEKSSAPLRRAIVIRRAPVTPIPGTRSSISYGARFTSTGN